MTADLSPEQQITVAMMKMSGRSQAEAEAIVRQDRMAAALIGAIYEPVLRKHVAELQAILKTYEEAMK